MKNGIQIWNRKRKKRTHRTQVRIAVTLLLVIPPMLTSFHHPIISSSVAAPPGPTSVTTCPVVLRDLGLVVVVVFVSFRSIAVVGSLVRFFEETSAAFI